MRVANIFLHLKTTLHSLDVTVCLFLFLFSFNSIAQKNTAQEIAVVEKMTKDYIPIEYRSHPDYLRNQLDGIPTNIELIQYRTASQKTFIDVNGNYHTQKTGGYFHYFKNGMWLDIQNNLTETSDKKIGIFNTELPIIIDEHSGETIFRLEKNNLNAFRFGKNVTLTSINASNEITQFFEKRENTFSQIDENEITYNEVFSNIDRQQNINYWSVKTDYKIKSSINVTQDSKFIILRDYVQLDSGYKIDFFEGEMTVNGWHGSLKITNDLGEILATISPAQIFDSFISSNKDEVGRHIIPGYYNLSYIGGNIELSILFDANYLKRTDLVYPVYIDPTVSNTYANNQRVQDKNTQFNANCQATMAVTFPISNFSVTGTNTTWRMWAKGFIYSSSSTDYYADKVEQRSRVGANGNWTATQNGSGTNFNGSSYNYTAANNGVTYTVNNSSIANGCYNNQNSINYFWQGYQTYYPVNVHPSTNVSGCVLNYQELVTNTWVVTTTYSAGATVNSVNSQTICAGQQTSSISFSGTGSSYNWTNNNTSIGLGASGTGTIAAFTASNNSTSPISSTITVTPMLNGCPGTPTTFTITVNPTPTVTNPGNQSICAGQSTTAVVFSGTSGATFNWTNNNTSTGLAANGTGNIASFTGTNTTNSAIISSVVVTPSIGTCNGTTQSFTITISPTPTVNAVNSQTVCAGQQTTTITFGGSATSYNWSNDNTTIGLGASGSGNIASFTSVNNSNSSVVSNITVTPVAGTCTGVPTTFTITVNPSPNVTTPSNQTVCVGQQTSLVNIIGTNGATFNWTNNNIATGLSANGIGDIPSFTSTNSSNSAIVSTVTITPSINGCNGSSTSFTITVNPLPTVNAITSQTICVGQQSSIISFSGSASIYDWTNDNTSIGLVASGQGNIAAFTATNTTNSPITGTITVIPTAGTCVGTPLNFSITVNPLITPTFNQLGPYCQNATPGSLSATSNNTPAISGTWSPATISTSTVGNQNYTFTPNNGQCASTAIMTINVTQLLTPTFTQLGPYCQNAASINLPTSSTNTPSITGTWLPSVVNTSSIGNSTYTFTPDANQCAGTTTMTILVNVNPTVSVNSQTICAGQNATLNVTASPVGGTYLWSNNQTTSSITITPNTTITYSVLYTVNGCNSTGSGTVTVNPIVTPTFNVLGPYCQNSIPGTLATTSTNNISGTWTPSSISTVTPGTQTYNFTPSLGLCASTTSMTVTITPLITPTFNTITTLCQNATAPLLPTSSTNTPSLTGSWSPATISTSVIGTNSYTFTPNSGQCASNYIMDVTVGLSPSPDIHTNLTQGCTPLSVTLSSQSIPNASYTWTSNGVVIGNGATLNTVFTNAGCFDIALYSNVNGCTVDTIVNDLICVENVPNAAFTLFPNTITDAHQEVQFNNNSTNAVNYQWYFGDGDSSSFEAPYHIYENATSNMLVTLTASSSFGCSDSYTVIIPINNDPIFYIPNTFTPDGDEHNQTWGPVFTKGFDPYNFQLQVFNRWGELIWESNDANIHWDGTYGKNGIKVQQGIYTYKIKFRHKETDKKYNVIGHINLLK